MTTPGETFVKVPTFIHDAVGTGRLSPTALALYVILRSHRNHRKQAAWPSLATLAREMHMKNSRNLIKYIRELEELRAVLITKDPGTSNTYMFPETIAAGGSTLGNTTGGSSTALQRTSTSGDTTTGTSGHTAAVPPEVLPPVFEEVLKPDRGNQSKELDQLERIVDTSRRPLRALDVQPSMDKPRIRGWCDLLSWLDEELGRPLELSDELYIKQKLRPAGMSDQQILTSLRERGTSRAHARAEGGFAKPAQPDVPWGMPT